MEAVAYILIFALIIGTLF
ncbi:MAG: photosystem II reaction center protein T, partial [Cyanobacteria bacterium J06623_5]